MKHWRNFGCSFHLITLDYHLLIPGAPPSAGQMIDNTIRAGSFMVRSYRANKYAAMDEFWFSFLVNHRILHSVYI